MGYPEVGANFLGRLAKVKCPKTKPLLPVFECITNSIDSIDTFKVGNEITISIIRDNSQGNLIEDEKSLRPIKGFVVEDDGVGLNEANFKSFCELDSTFKQGLGGKGIGRLTWLKAFHHVEVLSIFQSNGHFEKRHTYLVEEENPFKLYKAESVKGVKRKTTIRLIDYKDGYAEHLNKSISVIADKILCHFMPRFISGNNIRIVVIDGENTINLNDFYSQSYEGEVERKIVNIKDFDFTIDVIPTSTARENWNKVYYCAHKRTVESNGLEKYNRYIGMAGKCFAVYISGAYLDEHVSDDRMGFYIREHPSIMLNLPIGRQCIDRALSETIGEYTKPYVEEGYKEHVKSVEDYVHNKNPRYRNVLAKHPNVIEKIPLKASAEDIIAVLEVENQRLRASVNESIQTILKDPTGSFSDKKKTIFEYVKENYQTSKDILADYMIERKAILRILREIVSKKTDGSIYLESDVHNLIFPMGETSDTINYDEHHLWIIDERLAFHRLLTSDLAISTNFKNTSKKEPDLLCYIDAPSNKHNSFSSAIIVEFKRPVTPGRHKCPIQQVKDVVGDLIDGNVDVEGRKIKFNSGAHFYGYIVTEIDELLLKSIRNDSVYTVTPDNDGYFGYYKDLKLYCEIISFDKLIDDAEKRNQMLFHKLGIV